MNSIEKYGLSKDTKVLVDLLEEILEELKAINETLKGTRPSPS